jgi:TPR repeat protein
MSIKTALHVSFALVVGCTSAFCQENVPLTNCDKYAGSLLDPRMKGAGVAADKIDPKIAIPACEEAVRNYPNNGRFLFQLGRSYFAAKDDAQALAWYRKSADQRYGPGQYNLGFMYQNGRGVLQDDVQAVAWFRKAADQGDAEAQYNLGVMYAKGLGVPKDDAQAAAWHRKAADQGNELAKKELEKINSRR